MSQIAESHFTEITTNNDLFCQFDEENGVLLIDVKKPFTSEDFATISSIIDPYCDARGELSGIIINSKKFPYWRDAQNRAEYLSFAQKNHHKFKKAALGMGGFFVRIVARIGKGRVHPELKIFGFNKIEKAQDWILE